MKLRRCRATALAALSSVTVFAWAPLHAPSDVVSATYSAPLNKAVAKGAFHLIGPCDVRQMVHGAPVASPEAVEINSAKPSGGTARKEMNSSGATLQAQQYPAMREAPRTEVGEAPLAQSAPQGFSLRSQAAEGSGSILGSVLDVNGTGIPGAQIRLTNVTASQHYTLVSGENGEFAFTNLPPGTYFITVDASDFEPHTSAEFTISTGQVLELPNIQLSIATQRQVVVVRPTEVVAQMQMKAQEKQRLVGVLPSFYTSYVWNAAPLNTKQKFALKTRDIFDPGYLLGVAAAAGIEQANNSFAGYGQGAAGYGKRFAAAYADRLIGGFLSQAVFPSILHQDPRYFYQGSGSVKSRLMHALSWAVIARSDSGHSVPNYSYLLGDLTAGALSNLYYPPANRGVGLVFTNFAIGIAGQAADGAFREFVAKHLTRNVAGKGKQ